MDMATRYARCDSMAEPRISGFHAAAADRAETRLDLNERFMPHPASTFLVRCATDALASAALVTGDICIVDRSLEPRDGDLVIATANEELIVRRLRISDGRMLLISDPPATPQPLDPDSGIEIWGVISGIIRKLR